jgi:hypothetical protein
MQALSEGNMLVNKAQYPGSLVAAVATLEEKTQSSFVRNS